MCSQWNQINNERTQFKFVNQKNSTFEFHLESLQVKDMNIAFSKTFAFSNFRQLLFLFLIQPAPSLMPFFPAYPSLQTFVTQILSSPHTQPTQSLTLLLLFPSDQHPSLIWFHIIYWSNSIICSPLFSSQITPQSLSLSPPLQLAQSAYQPLFTWIFLLLFASSCLTPTPTLNTSYLPITHLVLMQGHHLECQQSLSFHRCSHWILKLLVQIPSSVVFCISSEIEVINEYFSCRLLVQFDSTCGESRRSEGKVQNERRKKQIKQRVAITGIQQINDCIKLYNGPFRTYCAVQKWMRIKVRK